MNWTGLEPALALVRVLWLTSAPDQTPITESKAQVPQSGASASHEWEHLVASLLPDQPLTSIVTASYDGAPRGIPSSLRQYDL